MSLSASDVSSAVEHKLLAAGIRLDKKLEGHEAAEQMIEALSQVAFVVKDEWPSVKFVLEDWVEEVTHDLADDEGRPDVRNIRRVLLKVIQRL